MKDRGRNARVALPPFVAWIVDDGGDDAEEATCDVVYARDAADDAARALCVFRPERYGFSKLEEVRAFLERQEEADKSFEGVVLRDWRSRWKIKTRTYVALHRLKDNGNLFNPATLAPLLLSGEKDEILAYFPEGREQVDAVAAKLEAAWSDLLSTWERTHRKDGQKDFALLVREHPFSSLLFRVRKEKGAAQDMGDLHRVWRESADLIVRRLFA